MNAGQRDVATRIDCRVPWEQRGGMPVLAETEMNDIDYRRRARDRAQLGRIVLEPGAEIAGHSTMRVTYVYVITIAARHSPCKVGIAYQPKRRLAFLQTSHFDELVIRASYPFPAKGTAHMVESCVRAQFADKRIRGEWYRTSWPILTRYIVDKFGKDMAESAENLCYPHPSHDYRFG